MRALPECEMGHDRIRYLRLVNGSYYWRPTPRMGKAGFQEQRLGKDPISAELEAKRLNAEWDKFRFGEPNTPKITIYPPGSLGEAYNKAMALRAQQRADKGIVWTKQQVKRDDWPRAWRWIGPAFGNMARRAVHPEEMMALRAKVVERTSETEAHRVIKVWRALWKKLPPMKYPAPPEADPSLVFANNAPDPRQVVVDYRDLLRLVQCAWREGYHGLAALLAVAWDTMLSPVDVRTLTAGQFSRDRKGAIFFLDRAKTGRAAAGTLSKWSEAILRVYLQKRGIEFQGGALTMGGAKVLDSVPMFCSRGGAVGPKGGRPWTPRMYSSDRMGIDYRAIRELVFGEDDERQIQDLRRSGHVEGDAGGATPSDASAKMANSISVSNRLRKTYNPVNVTSVRRFDEARVAARKRTKTDQK